MLEGETIFRLLAFYRPSPTASSCFLRFNCRVRNLWCHCCGGFSSLKLTHALGCTKWSPTSITFCCDRRYLWSCSHKHLMFLHMNGNWCTSSFVFAPHPHKHLSLGVHRRPKYHWLGGNKPNYKHNQRPHTSTSPWNSFLGVQNVLWWCWWVGGNVGQSLCLLQLLGKNCTPNINPFFPLKITKRSTLHRSQLCKPQSLPPITILKTSIYFSWTFKYKQRPNKVWS